MRSPPRESTAARAARDPSTCSVDGRPRLSRRDSRPMGARPRTSVGVRNRRSAPLARRRSSLDIDRVILDPIDATTGGEVGDISRIRIGAG